MNSLNVKYNSQRDNYGFAGEFKGSWQCFSTCAWMLMSYYTDKIDATDEKGLTRYVDRVSNTVGGSNYPKTILHNRPNITKAENSAFFWEVQAAGIEVVLKEFGVDGLSVYKDGTLTWEELYKINQFHPVIVGTSGLGGLESGHLILNIGGDKYHDPYGDARTRYKNINGEGIEYPKEMLQKHTYKPEYIRALYFNKMGD